MFHGVMYIGKRVGESRGGVNCQFPIADFWMGLRGMWRAVFGVGFRFFFWTAAIFFDFFGEPGVEDGMPTDDAEEVGGVFFGGVRFEEEDAF